MQQLVLRTQIHCFADCEAFARQFAIGPNDLILTNEWIDTPDFGALAPGARVVYQETYGMGEPTDEMVEAILSDVAQFSCKRVIAVGGGTIIDIAKVLAVAGGETVDALYQKMPRLTKRRELVIVPTTCGTGSEVTNLSILNRIRLGTKMGLVSEAMFADAAVLIPSLLKGLPFSVFATSSIDALVHAVESTLSPKATAYSKLFGYQAIEMIIKGYQTIAAEGPQARFALLENFLIASNFAGIAFGTAGCATVHAMSYPLGGTYHVAHGESNYALFCGVLRWYLRQEQAGELKELIRFLAGLLHCPPTEAVASLEQLLEAILVLKPLRDYGVTQQDLDDFSDNVMLTQGRLLANSPVPLTKEDIAFIYTALY